MVKYIKDNGFKIKYTEKDKPNGQMEDPMKE
jgi:hypothetical protein